MNIKQAKNEIKDAVEAYLAKDEYGEYIIPIESQRPLLLIGAPGIGKTAIMKQVASECGIGLVSYTITHHTRQSAIGLPYISQKEFGGKEYAVTEYTMSEIVASVYNQMEETGLKEGILFIDEINCASETLAPAMLQFLQYKTFGSHKVPDGWIIVSAGNPPEYNKSVREFDIVTLDRVKKIDVEEDYDVWKEYAVKQNVHSAIISYLDVRKENFYTVRNTAEGKMFTTARGWEDLSRIMTVYEKLKKPVTFDVIYQYLQNKKIAKDFAGYFELYNIYKKDYSITGILAGEIEDAYVDRLRLASFDEKLSVISLILSALNDDFKKADFLDMFVTELHTVLKDIKASLLSKFAEDKRPEDMIMPIIEMRKNAFEKKKKTGLMKRDEERFELKIQERLEEMLIALKGEGISKCSDAFEYLKELFASDVEKRSTFMDDTGYKLDNAFSFLEYVFGESQEMVVFVTELNSGYYSIKFIDENGCVKFYQHNKNLLFKERQRNIISDIDEINAMMDSLKQRKQ